MADIATKPTGEDVEGFLRSVPEPMQADCRTLVQLMNGATGAEPVMWGSSIVGFGSEHLRYASGRELDWFRLGFAPRKRALTLYLTGGPDRHADLLARLGPHTTGKGCLYLKRLEDVDRDVLAELLQAAAAQTE